MMWFNFSAFICSITLLASCKWNQKPEPTLGPNYLEVFPNLENYKRPLFEKLWMSSFQP